MNTMPFGKCKNTPLAEVPAGYRRWLTENGDLYEPLRSAVDAEIARRAVTPERAGRSASIRTAAEQLLAASGGQLAPALAALLAVIEEPQPRERCG